MGEEGHRKSVRVSTDDSDNGSGGPVTPANVKADGGNGHEATVIFHMTTPEERRVDRWKLIGIYLCLVIISVFAVFGIMADTDRRNTDKALIERVDRTLNTIDDVVKGENKKTREMLFKAYQQHEKRLDAIEKAIKKE